MVGWTVNPNSTWGMDFAGTFFGISAFHGKVARHDIGVPTRSSQNPSPDEITQYISSHFRVDSVKENALLRIFHCRPDGLPRVGDDCDLHQYADIWVPRIGDMLSYGEIKDFSLLFYLEFVVDKQQPRDETDPPHATADSEDSDPDGPDRQDQ